MIKLLSVIPLALAPMVATASNSVSLGYQNNQVVDKEGVVLSYEHKTLNNAVIGLNTVVNTNKSEFISYGAHYGVTLPTGTPLTLTPMVGFDYYEDIDVPTVSVAGRLNYEVVPTVSLFGTAKYEKDVKSNVNLDGTSYMIGLTKTFK